MVAPRRGDLAYDFDMASQPQLSPETTPERIFSTFNAFQQSFALKGAVELDLFTHIAEGASTAAELAARAHASERGMRILCDYLTVIGLLTRSAENYSLTQDAATFLNRHSPAYLGTMHHFLLNDMNLGRYRDVAAFVRNGGAVKGTDGMTPDHPLWVEFARNMLPIVYPATQAVAAIASQRSGKMKVLDIASSHGMFGIAIALRNPEAQVVAVDWQNVLRVGIENAEKAGVGKRYHTIPGSAFEVDFGAGFDVALVPNFMHHFDERANVGLLKKIRAALNPGARVLTVEFIPNDDRVSPPVAAAFSFTMLAATEGGQAYTFRELAQIFREAGFASTRMEDIPHSPQKLLITEM